MAAIDNVTIAPNTLAAPSLMSNADCAWVYSTKANSPPWLSSRPSASAARQDIFISRPRPIITPVFTAISNTAKPITNRGLSAIAPRSSIMPTARKNRPRRIDRKGSISASSSCRNGVSASMTPATKAPSAADRPSSSINVAEPTTTKSAATMNISRSPSLPIRRKTGRIRMRLAIISPITAATVSSPSIQPEGPSASAGLRLSADTMVISGMIDRS